ncbi:hypothetical protein AV530_017645 [Patagioenas fasciata monilis]|uniref:Uncharacterized protein n=1 Tax=Patagioenas fasciata monilis TaxID=372326 RepID=A0A1V4JH56_PATFA|nr:hypothetical protein AV530_017645 [Patagioenas fasciata monilis]
MVNVAAPPFEPVGTEEAGLPSLFFASQAKVSRFGKPFIEFSLGKSRVELWFNCSDVRHLVGIKLEMRRVGAAGFCCYTAKLFIL